MGPSSDQRVERELSVITKFLVGVPKSLDMRGRWGGDSLELLGILRVECAEEV